MSESVISIGVPVITASGDIVRWSVPVDGPGLPPTLWYEVSSEHAHMLSDRADAATIGLMIPALHLGLELVVEGPLTDELVFAFGDFQALYGAIGLGRPRPLTARRSLPPATRAPGVATGYSGGIDSFAVLAEHHYAADVPNARRVTHLLFNNVGAHGWGPSADALGRDRMNRLRPSVEQIGLPLVEVDSNLDAFYAPPLWFYRTHTPRNASVAHLLSKGIGAWLYASAYDYRRIGVRPGPAAVADPIALPLMSTSALSARDTGTALRRVDKTAIVAEMPLSWEFLDVCSNIDIPGAAQCSDCMKCRRTLLTLEVLGVVERYGGVFDLDHWAGVRDAYLWEVITAREDPLMIELRDLMDERGYRVPRSVVRYAAPQAWEKTKAGAQRVRNGVARRYRRVISR
ncbi:hypothetical protein DY023_01845 [Microbacterium bovistercoris]|uniref:Uncharacterized protein n=1 Tax=Microbacterium bovistercoris TaxID=2293570 RepID=A0A371NXM1_9MICO|nr:hypothetical protein [Microbacterium bovistercoris]REJ08031.1 hypothetical protein DY023_01845 [Microbacterium bovistercoris]